MRLFRHGTALLLAGAAALLAGCVGGSPETASHAPEPPLLLRLQLEPGSGYTVTHHQETEFVAATHSHGTSYSFQFAAEVHDVSREGTHTLGVAITHHAMSLGVRVGKPAAGDPGRASGVPSTWEPSPFDGQAGTVRVDARGAVQRVSGFDLKAPPFAGGLQASFAQMFLTYPQQPVAVGGSWSGSLQLEPNPDLPEALSVTYALGRRENGKAFIDVVGRPHDSEKFDGTVEGTLVVDEATGLPEKTELLVTFRNRSGSPGNGATRVVVVTEPQ